MMKTINDSLLFAKARLKQSQINLRTALENNDDDIEYWLLSVEFWRGTLEFYKIQQQLFNEVFEEVSNA